MLCRFAHCVSTTQPAWSRSTGHGRACRDDPAITHASIHGIGSLVMFRNLLVAGSATRAAQRRCVWLAASLVFGALVASCGARSGAAMTDAPSFPTDIDRSAPVLAD